MMCYYCMRLTIRRLQYTTLKDEYDNYSRGGEIRPVSGGVSSTYIATKTGNQAGPEECDDTFHDTPTEIDLIVSRLLIK